MAKQGWHRLLDGAPWFEKDGAYPLDAYSEFMPAVRLGLKAYRYAEREPLPFLEGDPWGWNVSEYEDALELRPGMEAVAGHVLQAMMHLGRGEAVHGLGRLKLMDNPYWPAELASHAGELTHERYVLLLALALSRTQDDKGRIRWTLFGNSEQGPARAFWKGYYTAPGKELAPEQGPAFIRKLLETVYGERFDEKQTLEKAGFRILPQGEPLFPWWDEGKLPSWTTPYVWDGTGSLRGVKYVLTFRPFERLPRPVRQAYLEGRLHLLPFPGSLLFWGTPGVRKLGGERPFASQSALLSLVPRHEAPHGFRVAQAGWMHEQKNGHAQDEGHYGAFRDVYRRTHRFAPVLRDQDEINLLGHDEKMLHVLFSTLPDDLGLYNKPMARNVQLWTDDFRFVLDGPNATATEIRKALQLTTAGGVFGYRFLFPAMRVGKHEVYWHRPLAAFASPDTGAPVLLDDAPTGYITAYRVGAADLERPVELWPRLLRREFPSEALAVLDGKTHHCLHQEGRNARLLYDAWILSGEKPIDRSLARSIIKTAKAHTLDDWLTALPAQAVDAERGPDLLAKVEQLLAPPADPEAKAPKALTYHRTARRSFEVNYWNTIAKLSDGRFCNSNNADCVRDPATQRRLKHHQRDLETLGDHLLAAHQKAIDKASMTGKALVGDLPFHWQTDFDFSLFGGWLANQERQTCERDLLIAIPGRDRSRAVIMADHYDTAYMYDHYHERGKPRLAAAGADDNHSATAALLLAAPVLLELSREGKLGCDVWLVHLTGEEFPSDCLGARHLVRGLVERNLTHRLTDGKERDLSKVRVQGAFVLDMVAHNNSREKDVFQMSPGVGRQSFWLAQQAHIATELWNRAVPAWNRKKDRQGLRRAVRVKDGTKVPPPFRFLSLNGEVRLPNDPRSTLYNTDALMFSDAGVPVVLFMENYDINRSGYHDSHDTMENIDLDYGAAVTAIAIETVARTACESPP